MRSAPDIGVTRCFDVESVQILPRTVEGVDFAALTDGNVRHTSVQMASFLSPEAAAEAADVCACFHLRKVARAVTRLYDEFLQPSGLRSTQFATLVAIHAEGVAALPTLATRMGIDRSVLTRGLQPLSRDGLVKVLPSPAGGISRVRLTKKGARRLSRAASLWEEAQGHFEQRFGRRRWQQLRKELGDAHVAAVRDGGP
jgi:DNA-binding MarR family transcriptional regulator